MGQADQIYAIEMQGISKYFGSFCALGNVDLRIKQGSIHALLGENGAGKSTLMNILYGLYQADSGVIKIKGEEIKIKNPKVAISKGIGMVHQHFMLVENFTVLQNIILGTEKTNSIGVIDLETARKEIVEISQKYGLLVDPDAKIEDISVGMQQRVEILKALYRGVDILILDEPTAVLTPQEISELILIMRKLTESGKTVIIITHKLEEIKHSADYCTIIRRGKNIDTVAVEDVTREQLASLMVGRDVELHIKKEEAKPGEVIFAIEDLTVTDYRGIEKVKKLSFTIKKGEIFGIAGIDGNGQTELVDAIMSMTRVKSGIIKINGQEIHNSSPRKVKDALIGTIPADRHKHGLVLDFTVAENMILSNYRSKEFCNKGVLSLKSIGSFAAKMVETFDVRPAGCEDQKIRGLSGGNQQKVIIAREVTNNPDLLIAFQPTRGLDVGAIEYVHQALVRHRDQGKAVLLISLELDEVMDVSDRIGVIYDGHMVEIMDAKDADRDKVGLLMAGGAN